MESWKTRAADRLRDHKYRVAACENLRLQIEAARTSTEGLSAANYDGVCVDGNAKNHPDDHLVDALVELGDLEDAYKVASAKVESVENALKTLGRSERDLLRVAYIEGEKGYAQELSCVLCVDVRTVYRMLDTALRKFTLALYGAVEA